MEHTDEPMTPTRTVALRVRELREKRRLTAAQLAEQMTQVGVAWDRGVVTKLETGRRENVSVAELLALAYVLKVAPVHLLVPLDDEQPYRVTPTVTAPAPVVRGWVRGYPAPGTSWRYVLPEEKDLLFYLVEVPDSEFPFTVKDLQAMTERPGFPRQDQPLQEAVERYITIRRERIDRERSDG